MHVRHTVLLFIRVPWLLLLFLLLGRIWALAQLRPGHNTHLYVASEELMVNYVAAKLESILDEMDVNRDNSINRGASFTASMHRQQWRRIW